MKRIIILLAFLFFGMATIYAQCNPFFLVKEGAYRETTVYNSKDKVEGRQVSKVVTLEESNDGWDAVLGVESYDKKDKKELDNQMAMSCEDGVIKMDMSRFMPEELMSSMKGQEIKISGDNLEWPSHLEVGMTLPDASITLDMGIMKMTIMLIDRKVEGKQTITTSAGSFDCFKVSYITKSEAIMKFEAKSVDYIAEKVGVVKNENYDKNGKLTGYTLLTQYGGF